MKSLRYCILTTLLVLSTVLLRGNARQVKLQNELEELEVLEEKKSPLEENNENDLIMEMAFEDEENNSLESADYALNKSEFDESIQTLKIFLQEIDKHDQKQNEFEEKVQKLEELLQQTRNSAKSLIPDDNDLNFDSLSLSSSDVEVLLDQLKILLEDSTQPFTDSTEKEDYLRNLAIFLQEVADYLQRPDSDASSTEELRLSSPYAECIKLCKDLDESLCTCDSNKHLQVYELLFQNIDALDDDGNDQKLLRHIKSLNSISGNEVNDMHNGGVNDEENSRDNAGTEDILEKEAGVNPADEMTVEMNSASKKAESKKGGKPNGNNKPTSNIKGGKHSSLKKGGKENNVITNIKMNNDNKGSGSNKISKGSLEDEVRIETTTEDALSKFCEEACALGEGGAICDCVHISG